ncbi:hypothetical protein [Aeromonas caviae]
MNNLVKVKNVPGTAGQRAPNNEPWFDFWLRHHKVGFDGSCSREGCIALAEHGAHVRAEESGVLFRMVTYIVPLCAGCNNPNNTAAYMVPRSHLVAIPSEPR